MGELGEFFGLVIIGLYGLTILNYILKFINKRYKSVLKKNAVFYSYYMKLMKLIIKNHKLLGLLTILALLTHFIIQFSQYGISTTGLLAASTLIAQVLLGIYGSLKAKKSKLWLVAHRSIAVLLLVAIGIHIL